jgi:diguanylate cyclase (GGDEF)-like protein
LLLAAVEATTDLVIVFDPSLNVAHANRAAQELLALPDVGATIDLVRPAATQQLIEHIALPQARRTGVWTGEALLGGADGCASMDASLVITTQRDEQDEVVAYAVIARDITERKLVEVALRRQARQDPLTGLLNRAGLMDELDRCLGADLDATVAVLFIDLDHFKIANDSLGHTSGDELLRQVARRLTLAAHPSILARYGGDEFVALLPDLRNPLDAERTARQICQALEQPISLGGRPVHLSASIGIALSTDSRASDDLLRSADLAMYRAKELGRNRWSFFDRKLHDAAHRRLQLNAELHRAIADDQLIVHYQPIVSLPTRTLSGFEALVRWNHPSGRQLQPGEFLDVAAQAQLMPTIDERVLHVSCAQLHSWHDRFPCAKHLTMAVNLSPSQLARHDLREVIAFALGQSGLRADQLHLEVSEEKLLQSIDTTAEALASIRSLGVKVAIDDFGTDHSSLAYLSALQVDMLKIDRGFLLGADHHAGQVVMGAVAGLARQLGLVTVAEGVETDDQLDVVERVGIDAAQGFLFARPMPGEDAELLVAAMVH